MLNNADGEIINQYKSYKFSFMNDLDIPNYRKSYDLYSEFITRVWLYPNKIAMHYGRNAKILDHCFRGCLMASQNPK